MPGFSTRVASIAAAAAVRQNGSGAERAAEAEVEGGAGTFCT